MSDYSGWLDAQGETNEFGGGRLFIPAGYHPVELSLESYEIAPEEDAQGADGGTYTKGGKPQGMVGGMIFDPNSPLAGADVPASRVSFTPGNAGNYTGWLAAACKAITQQPVDLSALKKYGFKLSGEAAEQRQQFHDQFFNLDLAQRKDFMAIYCRVASWDGKRVIVSFDREAGNTTKTRKDGTTYTPTYLRIKGFYSLNDPKHGLAWVKANEYPRIAAVLAEEVGA